MFLRYLHLNWYRWIVSIKNRILFLDSQCCNKQSQELACQSERLSPTQLSWQWSMNMITVLWCRFQQCLGTFTMVLVRGSSVTRHFRHLSDYVFRVRNIWSTKSMGVIFSWKHLKFNLDFKNAAKIWEKVFRFWDNSVWNGIVKLFLLRTGCLSSAASMLTSSPKIWHVNKRDSFQLNCLCSDQWIW